MQRSETIAALNDALRRACLSPRSMPRGCQVVITAGVQALDFGDVALVLRKVSDFDAFPGGNDSHGEHDFGAFNHGAERIMWKIDYYAQDRRAHSEDPADATKTRRVLTVMLASEY